MEFTEVRPLLLAALLSLGCGKGASPIAKTPEARASGVGSGSAAPADDSGAPETAMPTPGSDTAGVEIFSAARLADVAAQLARGSTTGRTIGAHRTYWYVESRRAADGSPEVHDDWVDVTMVQAGRASLLSGGR